MAAAPLCRGPRLDIPPPARALRARAAQAADLARHPRGPPGTRGKDIRTRTGIRAHRYSRCSRCSSRLAGRIASTRHIPDVQPHVVHQSHLLPRLAPFPLNSSARALPSPARSSHLAPGGRVNAPLIMAHQRNGRQRPARRPRLEAKACEAIVRDTHEPMDRCIRWVYNYR